MYLLSKGFILEGTKFPAFAVETGSILSLSWPFLQGGPAQEQFFNSLAGKIKFDFLEVFHEPFIADPFLKDLSQKRFSELNSLAKMSIPDFENFALDLAWNHDALLCESPLTNRLYATILYGCIKSKFIVTWFAGLDPNGERQIMSFIKEIADKGLGFLIIDFPLTSSSKPFLPSVKRIK